MKCKNCDRDIIVKITGIEHNKLDIKHMNGIVECDISQYGYRYRKFAELKEEDVNGINDFFLKWYDLNKKYILDSYHFKN